MKNSGARTVARTTTIAHATCGLGRYQDRTLSAPPPSVYDTQTVGTGFRRTNVQTDTKALHQCKVPPNIRKV